MSVTGKPEKRAPGERPPIVGTGKIAAALNPPRLYQVKMPNGHLAYAVVYWPKGEGSPKFELGDQVRVEFSPYDMSRCKIVSR